MLTTAQMTDIRRFCGYGMFGSQALPASGYRFSAHYGVLEYKMQNLTTDEYTVLTATYLANLYLLETDIYGSTGVRGNLDTDEAAVWKHNKNELRDRMALFNATRRMLCGFLGVVPGPALGSGGLKVIV